jgi:hypothetical protein
MSQCTRQKLTAEQVVPLLTYLTDTLGRLLQLYLRDFQSPDVRLSGLETLTFSPPVLREPAVLDPCYTGCRCNKSRFRVKNMELAVTAPNAAIAVKGYFTQEPVEVLFRKVSLEVETDCKGYLQVKKMEIGSLHFARPGSFSVVGFALRRIPRLLWHVRTALRTQVVGKKFILPVRTGADALPLLPLLCAPVAVVQPSR